MTTVKSRRDLYAEATRAALITEATRLFATQGFSGTSLDGVARAASVTRGAVYHHFTGKQDLFRAVVQEQEEALVGRLAATLQSEDDVWDAAMAAVDGFLDACLDPVYGKVVWQEGLAALGWNGLKSCAEEYSLALVDTAGRALVDAGYFHGRAFETTTRMIFHLLGGAAMTITAAEDRQRSREEIGDVVKRMIAGLRTDG